MLHTTIREKDKLLQGIADGLKGHYAQTLGCIEVSLYAGDKEVLKTDVPTVLDYLASDIYWNEDGNWANADRAEVRVI